MNDLSNSVSKRCNVVLSNPRFPLILDSSEIPSLNIGGFPGELNRGLGASGQAAGGFYTGGGCYPYSGPPTTVTVTGTGPTSPGGTAANVSNVLQQVGPWFPAKTAAGDFLKIQYAEVEVRCAITRKTVPAGSPIMLLGGMVISQEAFENWLEEHLSGMICRHQDVHMDTSGYDE